MITELELCGLAINIVSFSHPLIRVDFDTIVDHLALMYIIKTKTEPVTPRINRLLELISLYSFNLYYMKGKGMILSIFLSTQMHNDSNSHEIIPISFNMYKALHDTCYSIEMKDPIFSTDMITDESKWNIIPKGTLCKENVRHKCNTRKAKAPDTQQPSR